MSCISCHLTEATLEHRQDPSKRFCGNECYEEWRLRQGADATPIGEGIFMRMLRTPPASGFGETGQLNRDIFWKIMKSGNITAKDLVRDIGDVSNLPDTKEAYFAWRRRIRIIMKWIANATVDELPSKTLFLSEMLYTSIEEDFVYLRDFLWGRFPSLQNDYRDFPTRSIGTDMVKILVRHWPQKFWELVQQHDPLDLKYVMELTFIAASGNPMVIPLVQYFGKYYHVEELYKLLTGFKPNMRDVMAILDNPETYVSADENRLYKALEHESTRLTYRLPIFMRFRKKNAKNSWVLLKIIQNSKCLRRRFLNACLRKKNSTWSHALHLCI